MHSPHALQQRPITALDLIEKQSNHIEKLQENADYFRQGIQAMGYTIVPGTHPIVPIMLGDAHISAQVSQLLIEQGILAISFSYPVVPENQARIRIQLSAAHEKDELDKALHAFKVIGNKLNLLNINESIS